MIHHRRILPTLLVFTLCAVLLHTGIERCSAQTAELVVEVGHTSMISSVAFSPDGKLIASASYDNSVIIWRASSGTELKKLTGDKLVTSVAFSPDGKQILSGDWGGTIKLWDVLTGEEIAAFDGGKIRVLTVAFSADGRSFLSGGADNQVRIWDAGSREQVSTFVGHMAAVRTVAFSPDGKTVASGSDDKTIRLWDVRTGRELRKLDGHKAAVRSLAFSPNGQRIVTASSDRTVRLWNTRTGRNLFTSDIQTAAIHSVAYSPDGRRIVSGADDGTVAVWDSLTARQIKRVQEKGSINTVAISPTEDTLVSAGSYLVITSRDIATLKEKGQMAGYAHGVNSTIFSPVNGRIVASSSDDNSVHIWDAATGAQVRRLSGHKLAVESAVFSHDGEWIVTGSSDRTVRVWSVETGKELHELSGHRGAVVSVDISSDRGQIASGSWDGTVRLWDIRSPTQPKVLSGHGQVVSSVAFSPDSKELLSAGWDSTVRIWDVETEKEIRRFEGHKGTVWTAVYAPNGSVMASAGEDGVIRIWDRQSGSEKSRLVGHAGVVSTLKFSPDGKLLVSGGEDLTIRLWDLASGKQLEKFLGHKGLISSVTFSPDGKLIASGSEDSTTRIWSLRGDQASIGRIWFSGVDAWITADSSGRFDTDQSLDYVAGLHWVVNNEILKPAALDVFMRQYYEPGLLRRTLECNEAGRTACDKEFKPLPSIAEINRVQPAIEKLTVTPGKEKGTVNVRVEVESITEDVTIDASDHSKKTRLSSGVYDLRLFRDGQLVDTSTPAASIESYIKAAPDAVEKDRAAFAKDPKKAILNTNEDRLWRAANVLIPNTTGIQAYAGRICVRDAKTPAKAICTFEGVALPVGDNGKQKEVEFTAYAFNADRVKSDTAYAAYALPAQIAAAPRKGRAYLVSIGVNATEGRNFDLQYAAADADEMQRVLGERLESEKNAGRYSEVVKIPLISELDENKQLKQNLARKEVIRQVFALLAGEKADPAIVKEIPNHDRISRVQPEDTLIISFAGHGYADRAGIFYLMPYDIGPGVKELTPAVLPRLISSDELSLWMQRITATDMIMIIDACRSAAAVQGDGFKPGPMGQPGSWAARL